MEFSHNGKKYRVERGAGTGKWFLLELANDGPHGWRLAGDFDAATKEKDIIDVAKAKIDQGG